ncbi:hypothetical protein FEM48_Zijuj01G0203200 [Ziziphus jujuba var. spinosa]|uniref:Protein kinase domain-containing protein n=1 Tax=Ziziphus jujuba var. spinosa TaxID=714518 RepID=A0A978W3C7_ZIZJJ|nr:hypothetical protein FEM48_Zijuj01G0203200 [Ziziphus jujuba var. spinosa]
MMATSQFQETPSAKFEDHPVTDSTKTINSLSHRNEHSHQISLSGLSLYETSMKEPPLHHHHHLARRKRPTNNNNQPKKLKLVCSFNGCFQTRPPSAKLRYVGGETRIISVDRNISFLKLRSKIADLCPKTTSFVLKYQLPESDPACFDSGTPLVLIASDDDVRCMIDEYDKLELYCKNARLWVYVCSNNGGDNAMVMNQLYGNCTGIKGLNGLEYETAIGGGGGGVNNGFESHSQKCENQVFGAQVDGKVVNNLGGVRCGCGDDSLRTIGGGGVNSETAIGGGGGGVNNGFESHSQKCENQVFGAQVDGKVINNLGGVRCDCGDDSLRTILLKQRMVAKQSAQIHSSQGVWGFASAENEAGTVCCGENRKFDHPLIDLGPQQPQVSISRDEVIQSFEDLDVLDSKTAGTHVPRSENWVQFPAPRPIPLNPMDGNLRVEPNSSTQCLAVNCGSVFCNGCWIPSGSLSALQGSSNLKQLGSYGEGLLCGFGAKQDWRNTGPVQMSNFNRENIMPWGAVSVPCVDHLTGVAYPQNSMYNGNRVCDGFRSSIRNHRFGVNDSRNQRLCSYHAQDLRNMAEMGNHRAAARLDGRNSMGKSYYVLRPNTSIAKQGQSMRVFYPHSWRQRSVFPEQQVLNGRANMKDYSMNKKETLLYDVQYSNDKLRDQRGPAVSPSRNSKVEESYLAYAGACSRLNSQILSSRDAIESSNPCMTTMKTRADLLSGSNCEKYEISSQTLDDNFGEIPTSFDPIHCYEVANVSGFSNGLIHSNGTELGYNKKFLGDVVAVDSLSNHRNDSKDVQVHKEEIASSVNSFLGNPSPSSSKEVKPPAFSPGSSTDASSDATLKAQSKAVDLMEEGQHGGSKLSSQNAGEMKKNHVQEGEVQQDSLCSLSIDEKTNNKESHKSSKVIDGIPSDLAGFYTHLATRELQTIKNCDLEYIKELGSGTYGSVYHGKWKGCDVAVKRIKPSCFTDGTVEEDRLVADFWKEAHMLGQLHHPNIVAFYGVVTDGPVTNLATVTEYMVNGSLKQVFRRKDRSIDRRKRLIIAMDAAFGMEYLHGKGIVHFDLKSHNFLVNMRDPQRPICKIGDLGLSKIKQKTLVSGGVRGTIPWMAPELLNSNNNLVTEKVDVYSFGIVMWELLTGEEPYVNMRSEDIIAGIIKGNLRPDIPTWCDPAWRSLMEKCWSRDPDSRPSFTEISKELRTISATMNIK